jgi:(p)ppGpp synthase/HD superfamily hydrolase
MQSLEKALRIALVAHSGQVDKGGTPYIFHPIKVSERVSSIEEKIVALLHDTVEDSFITIETINKEFNPTIALAVKLLTKTKDTPYKDYIKKIKDNPLARSIKIADLKENLDTSRFVIKSKKDLDNLKEYQKALEFLS